MEDGLIGALGAPPVKQIVDTVETELVTIHCHFLMEKTVLEIVWSIHHISVMVICVHQVCSCIEKCLYYGF